MATENLFIFLDTFMRIRDLHLTVTSDSYTLLRLPVRVPCTRRASTSGRIDFNAELYMCMQPNSILHVASCCQRCPAAAAGAHCLMPSKFAAERQNVLRFSAVTTGVSQNICFDEQKKFATNAVQGKHSKNREISTARWWIIF
jgi:hypothetical protein